MNKEETMSIEDLFKERNEQGKRIEQLVLENEKLIGLCNKYEEEHKTTFEIWQKDIQANKKALEYLEEYNKSDFTWPSIVYKELKEILEGEEWYE